MLETSRDRDTLILRLAHGRANAMDTELLRALRQALDKGLASDARAIVITGTGAIFSAGVDLPRVLAGGRAYLEEFLTELSRAFRELFVVPKPVIAAVNGHAIAGGCIVACACDYRLMARGGGRIGLPELRVGVPFPRPHDAGSRMPRSPGAPRARCWSATTSRPRTASRMASSTSWWTRND